MAWQSPQQAQQRLGVLPDGFGLYPRLTAREHINYFGELHGISGARLRERADELIQLLDMSAIADGAPEAFRTANERKSRLRARSCTGRGNVLLDEPTNGLDVMSTPRRAHHRPPASRVGTLHPVFEPCDAGGVSAV
jgi:sodium transport system ATP-binding protein